MADAQDQDEVGKEIAPQRLLSTICRPSVVHAPLDIAETG